MLLSERCLSQTHCYKLGRRPNLPMLSEALSNVLVSETDGNDSEVLYLCCMEFT